MRRMDKLLEKIVPVVREAGGMIRAGQTNQLNCLT